MKKRAAERALTQGRLRYAATMDNLPFGQPFPETQPFPEKGQDVTEPAKLLVRTLLRSPVSYKRRQEIPSFVFIDPVAWHCTDLHP